MFLFILYVLQILSLETKNQIPDCSFDSEEFWNIEDSEILEDFNPDTCKSDFDSDAVDNGLVKTVKWVLMFLLLWASFYGVSANALDHLIHFLHHLFQSLAQYSVGIAALAAFFPSSYYLAQKHLLLDKDNFSRFVICPSCNSLYHFRECYEQVGSRLLPKTCSFVSFPEHPQRSRRKACNHRLVKEVKSKDGSSRLYPIKVYCFKSIKETLECMVKRSGFLDLCEVWRKRSIPDGYLGDIYEGKVWKEFMSINGRDFLSEPNNFCFMLNIDWFQPFKHTQYSLGVIYLVLLNLPRSVRFKWENIFVVGIIPGPSEPQHDINSYLAPLVDDLLELWERGMSVTVAGMLVTIHAVLLCVACDIPASRKTCGFLSHSASKGCSKCLKVFPYDVVMRRLNFSGFDACPTRTHAQHVASAMQTLKAKSQTERDAMESSTGSRYSELMRLPYFDCVRFTIIENPTANTSVVVVSTRHRTTFYSTTSFMHQHEHNCHY